MDLQEFWNAHPAAAVAFSGGVDSTLLLKSALDAGANVRAYFVKTEFQSARELSEAEALAKKLGAELSVVELSALKDEQIAENDAERCYYCKYRLFSALRERAQSDGFELLADGTNASDDAGDRPGMRALAGLGVVSPLRLCGLTKSDVRALARELELPNWDRPACACLATRIPTGRRLKAAELRAVERAEDILRGYGFTDLRVRLLTDGAKIQLPAEQLPRAAALHGELCEALRSLAGPVSLDLNPRPALELPEEAPLRETVCELRCNVDDMTGEEAAFAAERLLDAGALDAWIEPIVMKKGRPAFLICCLCLPERAEALTSALLRHTTTLGVRRGEWERIALARRERGAGPVHIKVAEGGGVRKEKAEFEDLANLARREEASLWEIRGKYGV